MTWRQKKNKKLNETTNFPKGQLPAQFPQRGRKQSLLVCYQLEDFATRKQTIPVKEPGEFRIASKYQRRSLTGKEVREKKKKSESETWGLQEDATDVNSDWRRRVFPTVGAGEAHWSQITVSTTKLLAMWRMEWQPSALRLLMPERGGEAEETPCEKP